jgi:4-carboxymuconolactone decarboxylase
MVSRIALKRVEWCAVVAILISCVPGFAQERLPPLTPERMTPDQRKAYDEYMTARKSPPAGPFAVMLRVPDTMDLAFKWRLHLTANPAISPRLTEFVIMVTARHWTQQYEWNAHLAAALRQGVKQETITAIAEGRRPTTMSDDEGIMYDLLTELLYNHGVSDATYAKALATFGEAGIVEATSQAGYYAMLAMVMNTARTPLPNGTKLPLTLFPQ